MPTHIAAGRRAGLTEEKLAHVADDVPPDDVFDEADWEHVTVFLDAGAPLGVAYSQHQGDAWSGWPAAAADDHPVVYVARGSHANYPLAGSYRVKVCWTIRIRRCTTTKTRDGCIIV